MNILSSTLPQVISFLKEVSGKRDYHAAALYREVYKNGNRNFFDCPEFETSSGVQKKLENKVSLSPGVVVDTRSEEDLIKMVTRLSDGLMIESVIIPMNRYNTLCVSSQVGCKMGCRFCRTGQMGFHRNLTVSEITGQIFNARFSLKKKIKNIVFMGMGEPLDNFENVICAIRVMNEQKGFDIALRHITLSTAGFAEKIDRLGRIGLKGLRLAVSVNAPDDDTRSFLMPINKACSMNMLKQALLNYPLPKRGTFLFEYILIKGLNDSMKDAIKLAEYIKPLPVRLNLIPYNFVEGFNYASPSDDEMNRFAQALMDQGVFVVKRWSKGRSVAAACGQLGHHC